MRTYFRSTKRAKQIATALTAAIPSYSHCYALNIVAEMFGYRDWHDLDTFTASYRGAATPEMGDLDPLDPRLLALEESQQEALGRLLGPHSPYAENIHWWIIHGTDDLPRRRLLDEPTSRPLLRCMAYDRFPQDDRKCDKWANFDYGDEGNFDCRIVPDLAERFGDAALSYRRWIDEHEDHLTAATIAEAMQGNISDETVATKLDDGSIQQARLVRIVAFEAGTEVIQGIALAELVLKVGADADITMDVTVHAAHTRSDEDYCDLALATTLMLYLEHAAHLALWSNVDNDRFNLDLDAVPMSSDAGNLVETIFELLTDEINQCNFAINCQGEIESEVDFFEFDTCTPAELGAAPG